MIASGYFYPFLVDFRSLKEHLHSVVLNNSVVEGKIYNC